MGKEDLKIKVEIVKEAGEEAEEEEQEGWKTLKPQGYWRLCI